MVMHGDILPAIPIVTPIYAVTAAKWRHLPAITMLWQHVPAITMLCPHLPPITAYFVSTEWVLYSVYTKKRRFSLKKMN